MKLVSFAVDGECGYGVVDDDVVIRLNHSKNAPADLRSAIAKGVLNALAADDGNARIPLASVELLAPIPNPGKILCVATNFREPSLESKPEPSFPLVFTRFSDSVVGHGEPLRKSSLTQKYDFEGELAVIIGRPGYKIERAHAMNHVAGYSCFNDGSVRDWQKHSTQFTPGKNFYKSGSMGPWLITADEVPNLNELDRKSVV